MLVGAPNFRDLGGHAARDGTIRTGKVYRSSQLSHLTDGDLESVRHMGLKSIIDLRSERERMAQPTPAVLRTAGDYLSPKSDTDFIFNRIFAESEKTAAAWAAGFSTFYGLMLDAYAPEFIAMFRAISDGNLPILIHCSAGKDRTGAASALLLDFLGVQRATIVDDYVRSSSELNGDMHFKNMLSDAKLHLYADLPPECRDVILGTKPAYLECLFATLGDRFGSVSGYLAHHGFSAAERNRITDALI
ncbi:tyrosine-protein phosphatase [Sphingobium baderi]|jgi:protein-tyrosine phosphatase|uniref:Protein tyrosine phosphatase n=1 Tax=Sphingobium baderi TaxID=1332080 RepID=A0A0S3EXN9_9SPHN|nr:tyrosine-protein phosphatase [Sphingobium baderi]ALR20201.1 protein tyrosine phosphatase [Sphingobium baderi]